MTRRSIALVFVLSSALLPLACGTDGDENGTGGASAAGTAGSEAQGGENGNSDGLGGEGGSSDELAAAHRAERCASLCAMEVPTSGANGEGPTSCGHEEDCQSSYCSTDGWDAWCLETMTLFLDCLAEADASLFYCTDEGTRFDQAGYYDCPTLYYAWQLCMGIGR